MSEDNNQQQTQQPQKPQQQPRIDPKPDPTQKAKKKLNVDISQLKDTLINYIVPIVSLLLSVLIGFFILYPSYQDLPELNAELEQKSTLEANLSNKLGNLNRLVDFDTVVEENSDLVNRVLVSEQLVPGLLTQVDRITRESGLTVTRLNYGLGGNVADGPSGEANYEFVSVNLGVNGGFSQLVTFLENLENAARIINVNQLRYSLNNVEDDTTLGISFVLVSPYVYIESTAVTDEPIDLDISDPEFVNLINRIKAMKYYDPNFVDESVPVEEAPEETEEGTPAEGEAAPAEETAEETPTEETPATEEQPEEDTGDGDSIFPN